MSIPVQPRHTLRNYLWVHKAYIQKGAPVKAKGFTGNPPRAKRLSNPKVHGRGVEMGRKSKNARMFRICSRWSVYVTKCNKCSRNQYMYRMTCLPNIFVAMDAPGLFNNILSLYHSINKDRNQTYHHFLKQEEIKRLHSNIYIYCIYIYIVYIYI